MRIRIPKGTLEQLDDEYRFRLRRRDVDTDLDEWIAQELLAQLPYVPRDEPLAGAEMEEVDLPDDVAPGLEALTDVELLDLCERILASRRTRKPRVFFRQVDEPYPMSDITEEEVIKNFLEHYTRRVDTG